MLYVHADVKVKYGQLGVFNEAMVTVKSVMEANGWRLIGAWSTIIGDLHEINVPTLLNGREDMTQDFVAQILFDRIPKINSRGRVTFPCETNTKSLWLLSNTSSNWKVNFDPGRIAGHVPKYPGLRSNNF